MPIRIAPTLAGMATYPFVRLEEARQRLLADGVQVIDFGKGDPNEPTDPIIREALVAALPERSPYPLAQGLPELRRAVADWCGRRFGVTVDPDTEIVPTYGSKEAIFSLAQVLVDPHADKRLVVFGEPAYPVYERGALFAGAEVETLPLLREHAFLPELDAVDAATWERTAIFWVNYPNNPTGAVAPLSFYEQLAELAARHDFVVASDEAYSELWFDEPPASALAGRGSQPDDRLPDAEQALVDDGLPVGLRRRPAGGDRRAEGVPADASARRRRSSSSARPSSRGATSVTSRRRVRATARSATC